MSNEPPAFSGEEELEAEPDRSEPPAGSGFYHHLGQFELRFAQIAVVAMTLLVLTSAISRTLGKPQSWTVDLATFSFAWAVFMGADVALRRGKMVTIDLVVERLSEHTRAWLNLVNAALIVLFLAAMVVLGAWLSYTTRERSFSGLPWLSYTWVTISVPIGCALMLYTTLRGVPEKLRAVREGQP